MGTVENGTIEDLLRKRLRAWEVVALLLGVVTAAGTVAGVLGRAFYVPRSEYTQKVLEDTTSKAETKSTLERINISLIEQKSVSEKLDTKLDSMAEKLDDLKIQVAGSARRP